MFYYFKKAYKSLTHLIFVNVDPRVNKDVIHLHKYKDHVDYRVSTKKDGSLHAGSRNFKKTKELKSNVDEGTKSKG